MLCCTVLQLEIGLLHLIAPPIGRLEGSILFGIGNNLNVDMGNIIFGKVSEFIAILGSKKRLWFSGLIGGILKAQGVTSRASDSKARTLKAMRFRSKIFSASHVVEVDSDSEHDD